MRVTELETGRNLLTDLEKLNRNFADVNRQLSSGKKLNKLSDSPLGSADLVYITQEALRLDAYRFNIIESKYKLSSADTALNEMNNAFTRFFTLGSNAANESTNKEGRESILSEMEILREQLVALANTQVDGNYIFAGTNVNEQPFKLVKAGDPLHTGLHETETVYTGNTNVISIPVGDGVLVKASVDGKTAFEDVFKKVDDIIAAVKGSIYGTGTVEGIGTALEGFGDSLNTLSQARGQVGISLSMVERMSSIIAARDVVLTTQRSHIEDANALEVAVRINQLQTAVNAALSSGGAILKQNTLFDIIG
ncbi:MAG: hypothetical protein LBJ21_08340 [Acidobacteriota bacterium]|jgi:flagellar hook-associated protein 3 FlgL|nr:hypothetical protein [Acidobacteriota bacterium]